MNVERKRLILSGSLILSVVALAVACLSSRRMPTTIVDFLNVGQGDAELIRSGDQEMLIDGGPDRTVLAELGHTMPFFDRTIEYVVLTHPHADHFTGLADVFRRYAVQTVILPEAADRPEGYAAFLEEVNASGAAVTVARCGDVIVLGSARVSFIAPCPSRGAPARDLTDTNQGSAVMKLEAFGRHVLFMADAQMGEIIDLLASGADLSADVLKVGHHGSRFATTQELLRRVRPTEAAIEVGRNYFGHPAPVVLARLREVGSRVWRTDRDGDIRTVISGDGRLTIGTRPWWRP